MAVFKQVYLLFEMIKFSHTIFALPFAILATILAAEGLPDTMVAVWILVCMVSARSAAMTFNRIIDRDLDKDNPRTEKRHLVVGSISVLSAWIFFVVMVLIFVLASYMLNQLAFMLSPLALLIILSYSYAKRFTILCHALLGLSLALAPMGAWIAVQGKFDPLPMMLALVVGLWTTGFDIIYACQDYEADIQASMKSIPAKFGITTSLSIAKLVHLAMAGVLIATIWWPQPMGWYFTTAVALVVILLIYEHLIVKAKDLQRLNEAFFTVNGIVSVLLMTSILLDTYL